MNSKITNPILASFLAAGVLLTGCSTGRNAFETKTNQEIAAEARAATVIITAGDSTGSGWFINSRGDIMTANHVANDSNTKIDVKFADGTMHEAKIAFQNKQDDITVLHVDGVKDHKYLGFGKSAELVDGDAVVVSGDPFDIGVSLSFGHVSAALTSTAVEGKSFVQTDAAINPGSSGGPALNDRGQVIGLADRLITPLVRVHMGQFAGIGLLVPSDVIVKDLQKTQFLSPSL